jgi:hypothetical protein
MSPTDEGDVLVTEVEGLAVVGTGGEEINKFRGFDGDDDEGQHYSHLPMMNTMTTLVMTEA